MYVIRKYNYNYIQFVLNVLPQMFQLETTIFLLSHICKNCFVAIANLHRWNTKIKKVKIRMDSVSNNKVYKRCYNDTYCDVLISPIFRNINIKRQHTCMNYAMNVQFSLTAFHIGHLGDSLGFIGGSLDLPEAQLLRQN